MPWLRVPGVLVRTPLCMLWLVPLTAILTAPMGRWGTVPSIAADLSAGVLPMPHVLAYYGAFFAFGAMVASMPGAMRGIGRGWWAWLAVAVVVFLPAAAVAGLAPEAEQLFPDRGVRRIAGLVLGATYAWCMCLGLVGAAARFLHAERPWMRWMADSSYWMYVAHLPLVLLLQWAVSASPVGAMAKFAFIVAATTGVLLVAYAFAVRPTWIGRMLNGPRP
jgi:peptidoglycan/LPS O-acetylase OafA/YrhL